MCEIISELLKIDYNYLYENLSIVNGYVPSLNINRLKSISDIVCVVDNNQFIIEMNNDYYEKSIYKNGYYLFSNYSNKANNGNNYGKDLNTYLINIDNFDVINKNEFIYTFRVSEDKYNTVIYKNIKIININLDYLKKLDYNKYNKLEKLFKIFVETNLDNLKDIMDNKNIERVIKYMMKLKDYEKYIVKYDYEDFMASRLEDLKEEGLRQGIKQGIEQGMEVGKKEFMISTIKKMRENNIKDDIIANVVGLSIKEVNNII